MADSIRILPGQIRVCTAFTRERWVATFTRAALLVVALEVLLLGYFLLTTTSQENMPVPRATESVPYIPPKPSFNPPETQS